MSYERRFETFSPNFRHSKSFAINLPEIIKIMARVDNKGMVHGTAGSVIYKRSATEFGLSSSAAAVIRSAFEAGYFFKDGTAAYRSTQMVYQSILHNVSGEKGKRDLHDGDLSLLNSFEFNANSKLNEVLQMSYSVSKELVYGNRNQISAGLWYNIIKHYLLAYSDLLCCILL